MFYFADFEVGADTVPDMATHHSDIMKFPDLFSILLPTIHNFPIAY